MSGCHFYQVVAIDETLPEHTLRVVGLRKISLDFVKFGKTLKNKHKDMYLHLMHVKMAAASSKAVSKLSLLTAEMGQETSLDIQKAKRRLLRRHC